MDIFSFLRTSNKKSKDVAKDRLKLVLIHDRGDFSPEKKDMIRQDLCDVLKKYMEVEEANIEINIINKKDSDSQEVTPQLTANVPIKKIF